MQGLFFVILVVAMFAGLVVQHFIGPLPMVNARVLLMPVVMFYGSLALPNWGMLALSFLGGLMWDSLHVQILEGDVEIGLGWSIILYSVLGSLMSGFRPLFQRGRWEIHCLLSGVCCSAIVLAEYLMLTIRRQPMQFLFDQDIWWRIGGAGLVAFIISPFVFFTLNYVAYLIGYDTQPDRGRTR